MKKNIKKFILFSLFLFKAQLTFASSEQMNENTRIAEANLAKLDQIVNQAEEIALQAEIFRRNKEQLEAKHKLEVSQKSNAPTLLKVLANTLRGLADVCDPTYQSSTSQTTSNSNNSQDSK